MKIFTWLCTTKTGVGLLVAAGTLLGACAFEWVFGRPVTHPMNNGYKFVVPKKETDTKAAV